jgi:lysophospholipase L1-like esterase
VTESQSIGSKSGGRPLAAFIGDSYLGGGKVGRAQTAYGFKLAQQVRWDVRSVLSTRGGGYVRSGSRGTLIQMLEAQQFRGFRPDVVVVQAGINDRPYPLQQIARAEALLLSMIREMAPTARVVVLGVLSPTTVTTHDPKYQEINAALGGTATDSGASFLDPLYPLLVYSVGRDRLHPTEKGHIEIANWAASQLTAEKMLPSRQSQVTPKSVVL